MTLCIATIYSGSYKRSLNGVKRFLGFIRAQMLFTCGFLPVLTRKEEAEDEDEGMKLSLS